MPLLSIIYRSKLIEFCQYSQERIYHHGLTVIMAWINNHTHSLVLPVITHPCYNVNDGTLNHLLVNVDVVTCPCPKLAIFSDDLEACCSQELSHRLNTWDETCTGPTLKKSFWLWLLLVYILVIGPTPPPPPPPPPPGNMRFFVRGIYSV